MADKVEAPDRVVFYNMKDGSPFFDCHPAEARAAIEAVKRMRQGSTIFSMEEEEANRIRDRLRIVLDADERCLITDIEGHHEGVTRPLSRLSANFIADCFACIESLNTRVSMMVLNSYNYADLRKWDRDTLEIETRATFLKAGKVATLWGCEICVSPEVDEDQILFVGQKDDLVLYEHRFKRFPRHAYSIRAGDATPVMDEGFSGWHLMSFSMAYIGAIAAGEKAPASVVTAAPFHVIASNKDSARAHLNEKFDELWEAAQRAKEDA